jgi:cystathionine gamma-lyase
MMDSDMDRRMAMLLHHRSAHLNPGESVALPITSSTTFHSPDGPTLSHVYGRSGMPTWEALEAQLALIEDAPCVAFPSGMAAISAALMAGLGAGKRLILPADGYYVGRLLADQILRPYGVTVQELPTAAYDTADFTGAAMVLVETPSNPRLDVCDLRAVAARVHAAGGLLVADNTTMTPLLQRPLDLGADVVVAADTKAPAGHSDALFGHVASRNDAFIAKVRDNRRLTGAVPGAFEAWLVHRGIETLEVRLERMCASAQTIAERLAAHPAAANVRYPGLPADPSHRVARQQMAGFGFLIGFELPDAARAERFLSACPLIVEATSFGSTHTSGERRARWGDAVPPGFIRLSVGIEPVEPLWAAIATALDASST